MLLREDKHKIQESKTKSIEARLTALETIINQSNADLANSSESNAHNKYHRLTRKHQRFNELTEKLSDQSKSNSKNRRKHSYKSVDSHSKFAVRQSKSISAINAIYQSELERFESLSLCTEDNSLHNHEKKLVHFSDNNNVLNFNSNTPPIAISNNSPPLRKTRSRKRKPKSNLNSIPISTTVLSTTEVVGN